MSRSIEPVAMNFMSTLSNKDRDLLYCVRCERFGKVEGVRAEGGRG